MTRKQHLWIAAALWSVVGAALFVTGVRLWFLPDPGPPPDATLGIAAVILGLVKGQLVLDRTAGRVIARVPDRPDPSPARSLYRMFGPRMLVLIGVMVALGMLLRSGVVSDSVRGFVCLAIGAALLWSSRCYWRASAGPGPGGAGA